MRRLLWRLRRVGVLALMTWLVVCACLMAIIHGTGTRDEPTRADVIIVLGAALTETGEPGKALRRRARHAAKVWGRGQAGSLICTGGVGPHLRRSEAEGCREVLMAAGVPRAAILLEEQSRSTAENVVNAHAMMVPRGWTSAALVSDSYHVFRARHLARHVGLDVVLSPVPAATIESPLFYVYSVIRELAALHRHVLPWAGQRSDGWAAEPPQGHQSRDSPST